MQKHYWDDDVTFNYEDSVNVTDALKERLQGIRYSVDDELGELSPLIDRLDCEMEALRSESNKQTTEEFVSRVMSLSLGCNEGMVQFTAKIMEKATTICGAPPCQFSAVAIGSMARGETTPYSDLEFFFLVANTDSMAHFRRLAVTVYFVIGNLGETKLKYMNIEELKGVGKWFDDMSVSGFKIDGLQKNAGNIPTGNGSEKQMNQFIQTVNGMVDAYKHILLNPDGEASKMGDLSAMLSSTVLFYGNHELYDEFVSKKAAIKPLDSRRQASLAMLQSDMNKFDYQPDETMTHIKDIKNDFYRFPSIVILDLKILHHVSSLSVWETLDTLMNIGVLSPAAANALRVALSISIYARLSAYCYHSSQDDRMTVIESTKSQRPKTAPWFFPRKLLIHYFLHSGYLKLSALYNFVEVVSSSEKLNRIILIWILYHCQDYKKVVAIMDGWTREELHLMPPTVIVRSLIAINVLDRASELLAERLREEHSDDIIDNLNECIGAVCFERGDYNSALDCHQKSLNMQLKIYGDSPHSDIAWSYNNIGNVYRSQGEYTSALDCY